jgi:uncharacterized membrane protein YeaQ/YmgE (transglycosylase-associated protein family)
VSVIVYLLVLFVVGLIVGGLARLALPGRDPMPIWMTALIGIAGSFLAGFFWLLVSGRNGGGIVLSVAFATLIVYLIRRSRGGGLTHPGTPPD